MFNYNAHHGAKPQYKVALYFASVYRSLGFLTILCTSATFAQVPGTIERMAKVPNGGPPDDYVAQPHLSYDGRYVMFSSRATDILPGMPPPGTYGNDRNYLQWYLFDRQTRTTERITQNAQGIPQQGPIFTGAQGDQGTRSIDISLDGRYVVYDSEATNLVLNDTNNFADVFLFDRITKRTTLISLPGDAPLNRSIGQKPIFVSHDFATSVVYGFGFGVISGGRYRIIDLDGLSLGIVAPDVERGELISKIAKNVKIVVRGQYNLENSDFSNIVRLDLNSKESISVAFNLSGDPVLITSIAKISDDGKTVVYMSNQPNITNAPYNLIPQIYAWREETGRIQLVSKSNNGFPSIGLLKDVYFDVSSDGRYVVWSARDVNLGGIEPFPREGNTVAFYISDLHTGQTRYAANDLDGRFGGEFGICETIGTAQNFNDFFLSPITRNPNCATISGNGRVLAFSSLHHRWTIGDLPYQNLPNPLVTNPRSLDVFIKDMGAVGPISPSATQVPSNLPWALGLLGFGLIGLGLLAIRRS